MDRYGYGAVAGVYEGLARLYSLDRIAASKRSQLVHLQPGQRVLYAGVGRGEDALEAARAGACVTAVDISPAMLRGFARRLEREGLQAELVQADAARFATGGSFDVVVANYFLNLFSADRARVMTERLAARLRPGGRLLCADFAPAEAGPFRRSLAHAYYRPVNVIAWALRLGDLHPIHDYPSIVEPLGFRVVEMRRFPLGPAWAPGFLSLAATRE